MTRNAFFHPPNIVTENAPISVGCLWYFGIGFHRDPIPTNTKVSIDTLVQ